MMQWGPETIHTPMQVNDEYVSTCNNMDTFNDVIISISNIDKTIYCFIINEIS